MIQTGSKQTPTPADLLKDARRYSVASIARQGLYNPLPSTVPDGLSSGLFLVQLSAMAEEIPDWYPVYPNFRDLYLRWISKQETMIASGLYNMKTRLASLDMQVNGGKRAQQAAQDLFKTAHYGHGLGYMTRLLVDDLLTTDNGAFIEKWGPGRPDRPLGARQVVGINHLDSRQCWRTFDPEFPVIYTNPQTGELHKLHFSRVVMLSENPQPIEVARGVGYCAMSRALRWIKIMRDTLTYRDEKISGRFTRAIGITKGITTKQFERAMEATEEEADRRGYVVYKGMPFITTPGNEGNQDVDIILRDLASVPDGFDFQSEIVLYAYVLAMAFGVDAREFWPATQSGATKADASVQNMKMRGRGLGNLIKILEWGYRECAPDGIELEYDYIDDEQDRQQAEIHQLRTNTLATLQSAGAINPAEMRAQAIAYNILDPAVMKNAQPLEAEAETIDMGTEPLPSVDPMTEEPLPEEPPTEPNAEPPVEAAAPAGKTVKKKAQLRTPVQGYYEQQVNDFQRTLEAEVEQFIQQLPDTPTDAQVDEASDRLYILMGDLLARGMTNAYGIGLAGGEPSTMGLVHLQQSADQQAHYLRNSFVPALRGGLIAGLAVGLAGDELRAALSPMVSRAALYAGAFWSSIWVGLHDHFKDGRHKVRRRLDPIPHDVCATCPPKEGIYDNMDQMFAMVGYPADGSDDCKSNCRCIIEVETSPGSGVFERFHGDPTRFSEDVVTLHSYAYFQDE